MDKCKEKMEIYSRVCGYYRPVQNWNLGKKQEFKERVAYDPADLVGIRSMDRHMVSGEIRTGAVS